MDKATEVNLPLTVMNIFCFAEIIKHMVPISYCKLLQAQDNRAHKVVQDREVDRRQTKVVLDREDFQDQTKTTRECVDRLHQEDLRVEFLAQEDRQVALGEVRFMWKSIQVSGGQKFIFIQSNILKL